MIASRRLLGMGKVRLRQYVPSQRQVVIQFPPNEA
jgi:hypothetical protein